MEVDPQRAQRIIRNREAAAKSRARRDNMLTELRTENELLREENKQLKERIERLMSSITSGTGICLDDEKENYSSVMMYQHPTQLITTPGKYH